MDVFNSLQNNKAPMEDLDLGALGKCHTSCAMRHYALPMTIISIQH